MHTHTHSQLSLLQASLTQSEGKIGSLEAALTTSREHSQRLEEQLSAAEEKQLALEQSRGVLESVGAERLSTITALQSEVEAGRVRERLVQEMKEQLSALEQLLRALQDEVSCEREGEKTTVATR